jgi:hypothetical protein
MNNKLKRGRTPLDLAVTGSKPLELPQFDFEGSKTMNKNADNTIRITGNTER